MLSRFRWFSLVLVGVLGVVGAIVFTACSTTKLTSPGTTLVLTVLADPKTFNYVLNTSAPDPTSYVLEGLITENGETGEIEPALAESWDVSPNSQRIVFTLREGLKWSDGEPLTVDDVVFTYNDLYFNEAIPTSIRDVLRIGENEALPTVRKLNDRQVEFISPEPFAPLLRNTGLAILPAHILRESVETSDEQGNPLFLTKWGTDTDPTQIIGNSAYTIASYDTSQRIVYERNPNYWRKGSQGEPQPYIERIVLEILESTDAALIQFRSGGVDAIGVTPDYFSLMKREEQRGGFTIYNGGTAPGTTFISFNLNQGKRNGVPLIDPVKSRWFNTIEFRQAIAYGIDRQRMLNNTFQGLGELQNSPISIQSPYYLSPKEGLPVYEYDPEQAKALLQSVGFQYNTIGQLFDSDDNRVRFTLITNAGNKIREAMASQIKQDLSQIGIQVDLFPLTFNTLINKLNVSLDWECYLLGFTGGVEPNSGSNVWKTEGRSHRFNQAAQPGDTPIEGRIVSDWEKEIERLYIQGAQTLDEVQRKAIYAESQRLTQAYLPFIYLVNPFTLSAVRDTIEPIKFSALSGALWNIYELQIKDEG